jgi:peptidyl-prolyl cis-trans isomerase C
MKVMRNSAVGLLVIVAFVFCLASAGSGGTDEDKVATVNGAAISKGALDKEADYLQQQLLSSGAQSAEVQLSDVRNKALENLISRQLLYGESKAKGIKVDGTLIDEELKLVKARFPGDSEFKEALARMGLSEASMRSELGEMIAIRQLLDKEVVQKATVSETEARAYYDGNPDLFKRPEQVKAQHILVKVDAKADETKKTEAHKKAEAIEKSLKKDGDFSALAKQHSECPSSANGGDLGYFARGDMVKAFEDVAFALPVGQVSGIVTTDFGYHLIKVVDKKPEGVVPFDDVKTRLESYMKQQKVNEQVSQYLQELRKKASIKKFAVEDAK